MGTRDEMRRSNARAPITIDRLDVLRAVELAYAVDVESDAVWLERAASVVAPAFEREQGWGAWFFEQHPSGMPIRVFGHVGTAPSGWVDASFAAAGSGHPMVVAGYRSPVPSTLLEWLGGDVRGAFEPIADGNDALTRLVDNVGMLGCDPEGHGLVITAASNVPIAMSDRDRVTLGRIGAHLRAGYRLRRKLAVPGGARVEAVLDLSGELVHAEGEARAREARAALRSATRAIDGVRRRARKSDEAPLLERWRALVAGRWSLVEQWESDGRAHFVARRNDPDVAVAPRLTTREAQVLAHAALGARDKEIAYDIGISTSAVAAHLSRARKKLRAQNRIQLCAMATARGGDAVDAPRLVLGGIDYVALSGRIPTDLSVLTPAERGTVWAALGGWDNATIAAARGVAPRTVANQLASSFRKLGVGSRTELAMRLLAPPGRTP